MIFSYKHLCFNFKLCPLTYSVLLFIHGLQTASNSLVGHLKKQSSFIDERAWKKKYAITLSSLSDIMSCFLLSTNPLIAGDRHLAPSN